MFIEWHHSNVVLGNAGTSCQSG